MINKSSIPKILLFSFFLGVFFVSTMFIPEMISYKFSILPFLYMLLTAVIYGIALTSENRTITLFKWFFSLPFSFLILLYFQKTNYAIRALNWCIPGYGRSSAGGGFAGMFLLTACFVFFLISAVAAFSCKAKSKKFNKLQLILTCSFGIIIAVTVILLEQQFPSFEYIKANWY